MLIKSSPRTKCSGASIMEMIVTLGVMIVVGASFSIFLYSASHSLMNMYTYAGIDSGSQDAVNAMTREIRSARRVIGLTNGNLTIENTNGVAVTYAYRSSDRTLVRTASSTTRPVLRHCDSVSFTLCKGQQTNTFENFITATNPAEAKVINFTWRSSRAIGTSARASDSLASAKIVMRNQGK